MLNFFRRIFRSELLVNSGKLLTANVLAQVIAFLISPILSRLYSQEDFGLLNLFLSIGGVCTIIATADYQYAIALPKDEKKAVGVFHVGFIILCVFSLVLFLVLPFSSAIVSLFRVPDFANYLWMMPICVFSLGLWQLLNYWYARGKHFMQIGTYQLLQGTLSSGGKLGLGFGNVSGGMLWSVAFAPLLSVVGSMLIAGKRVLASLFNFDRKIFTEAAHEYRNFPLYSQPKSLLNNLSSNMPTLLLIPAFGEYQIGLWAMGITLAFRPINIIASSIYQVMFQHIASSVSNWKTIMAVLRKFVIRCMLIVVPIFAVLYFFLPALAEWFLGDGWELTGEYIRIMLPWLFMVLITTSINFLPDVFGRQRTMLWIEIAYFVIRLLALLAGIYFSDFVMALRLYLYASAVVLFIELLWFHHLVINYEKSIGWS